MKRRFSISPLRRLAGSALCLMTLLGLPRGLSTTNVFLETFDHWPPAGFSFPNGGTNWLSDGALRLAATYPASTGSSWAETGVADSDWGLFKGYTLERRLDVRKFTTTHGGHIELGCYGYSSQVITHYMLLLGEQDLVLIKYLPTPPLMARLICEPVTFPIQDLTLVLGFTSVGDSLEIRVQVLDKADGDTPLFERTFRDTPEKDAVASRPWLPGTVRPNEDSGEPYLGGAYSWFGIMNYGPTSTRIEAVFDNYQATTIGVGLDEFAAEVFTNAVGKTLAYRLFIPPDYDPANQYPLVLFLHGASSATDNATQVAGAVGPLVFGVEANQQKQACFLLVPTTTAPWMSVADSVLEVLTNLQQRFPIDPDRLYVTGLSGGGVATFDFLAYRPGLFAAGIPMSGASAIIKAPAIAHIPIWAFCGAADNSFVTGVRQMVDALGASGGRPIYTEYIQGGHMIWADAYQTPGLYEWLMAQRRGQPVIGPPALTIQSPTGEATWTTWSNQIDLAGVVSPSLDVTRVDVVSVPGGARRAKGTNLWSFADYPLTSGVTNILIARAHAPSASTFLGGETTVSQTLRVVQKQLALQATLLGEVVELSWTPGAPGYVVERCTDLAAPDWLPNQTTTATELTLPRTTPQAFYRVKLSP